MKPAAAVSREEIDSLLGGIAGTPAAAAAARTEPAAADVRGCNLAEQERHVAPDMPGLEAIHERMATQLQDALLGFARRASRVTAQPVAVRRYGEYVDDLAAPTSLSIVDLAPLRGRGLVVCEPSLVCGLVDVLFGGSGRFPAGLEGRSFSATEQRIVERLVGLVGGAYADAWAGVQPLQLTWERGETEPRRVRLVRPNDIVLVVRFIVQCGDIGGAIELCLPYAALDPIRQALYTAAAAASDPQEARWSARLTQELQSAEVDLVAELAQASATVQQLLALKVGDFMEIEISPSIRAFVDGVPVFDCHYGTCNGRSAIRIDQPVAGSAPAESPA